MGQGFESLQACHFFVSNQHMVDIAQLAEHRIVVPGVVGSSPIIHPIQWLRAGASAPALASLFPAFFILGCSQVVRHGTLTPAFVGSSPTIPARSAQGKRIEELGVERGRKRICGANLFCPSRSESDSSMRLTRSVTAEVLSRASRAHPPAGGRFGGQPHRRCGSWAGDGEA